MTAVVVVPSLVVAMRFARRGSVWAQLSTTSLFAYLVYTYAHYLSGAGFNDLFLLRAGFPTLANGSPDLVILPAHDPTAASAAREPGAAMASFENTVTIRRPVEDVFAFLADFENVTQWNYAIVETTKVSPGPVGVGTTYRQTRSAPSRSEEAFAVTVFEPASRLEVQGRLGPFTARVSYLLEPTGSGTRLTNTVDLGSSGLLTVVAPLATSRVKHAVAANLDTLKQLLEGGGRPGVG